MSEQKRVIVLGSQGMVGSRVADHLATSGHQVTGLTRRRQLVIGRGWNALRVESYGEIQGDFEADVIVNCAGPSAQWAEIRPRDFDSFIRAHSEAILALRTQVKASHVVNLSTVRVYSKDFVGTISESHPHDNDHPYAKGHSKLEIELSKWPHVTNLRLSNSFGASRGLSASSSRLFTQDMVRQFVARGFATISGNPATRRDFIALSDVVAALEHVLSNSSDGNFNLASTRTVKLEDWANYAAVLGSVSLNRELRVICSQPESNVNDYQFACEKLQNIGFVPKNLNDAELQSLFEQEVGDQIGR